MKNDLMFSLLQDFIELCFISDKFGLLVFIFYNAFLIFIVRNLQTKFLFKCQVLSTNKDFKANSSLLFPKVIQAFTEIILVALEVIAPFLKVVSLQKDHILANDAPGAIQMEHFQQHIQNLLGL